MKISFKLGSTEITKAIKEVQAYKKWLLDKTLELKNRIAEELVKDVQANFDNSIIDDWLLGGGVAPDVSVSVGNKDGVVIVIAKGEDAIWAEFGAGVYYNGAVGGSPHPKGTDLKMTIGSYGKGNGKRNVWGFYEDGKLQLTRGTKMQMPMYRATRDISGKINAIAREVFNV